MSSIPSGPRRAAVLALLAAVSGGALSGMALAARSPEPARCEIDLSRKGGSVTLTARAHADKRIAGQYSLLISGSGTRIRQGGPFEAAPGRPATLGTVTLGTSGSAYRAELDLDLASETVSCSKRIGGGI